MRHASSFLLFLALQLLAVHHHVVLGQEMATLTEPTAGEETVDLDEPAVGDVQDNATEQQQQQEAPPEPIQAGPLIDLFGPKLQSLQMVDETQAQIGESFTNEALKGKTVIGIYFSADW